MSTSNIPNLKPLTEQLHGHCEDHWALDGSGISRETLSDSLQDSGVGKEHRKSNNPNGFRPTSLMSPSNTSQALHRRSLAVSALLARVS